MVAGSVTFDPCTGIAIPVDRESKRGLDKSSRRSQVCYVRDIEAHETIEVTYTQGHWVKALSTAPADDLALSS